MSHIVHYYCACYIYNKNSLLDICMNVDHNKTECYEMTCLSLKRYYLANQNACGSEFQPNYMRVFNFFKWSHRTKVIDQKGSFTFSLFKVIAVMSKVNRILLSKLY